MPFASLGLVPELVRAVAEEGYAQPTPIQQEAIPLALAGRDLIGSAQTGTGKTAAFMLPILQRLTRNGTARVLRALVLVPTRELAEQVHRHQAGEGPTRAPRPTPAGQTLVFTRTKYGADKLVTFLRREGIPAHAIHGDKAQSHRTRTLDAFREGRADVLVATDIAARGIDVDGIRMVVNFDVPHDAEVYVHRVGRTARAGARGLALTPLVSFFYGKIIPLIRASINLARPGDLLFLVQQHLLPLRQPSRGPSDREQHGEHVDRELHRLVDDAGVEVDVGVELAGHEVVILQRDALELDGDVDERVLPRDVEHLVGDPLDDLGARVVVLVDAVTEPEQPELAPLHAVDVGRDAVFRADLAQRLQDFFVGAAVQRAVQGRRGRRHRRIGIGVRRAHAAHRAGGAVLLVIGMQDEQHVQGV